MSIEIGQRYLVSWITGEQQQAEILERRPMKQNIRDGIVVSEDSEDWEYYVHYLGFDRRLDEWVTFDRIDQSPIQDSALDSGRDLTRNNSKFTKKNNSKRKFEDISESIREGNEILANLEKEHEDITKVKNIRCVELGRFEIDTWYFSPYPDEYCHEEKLYICEYCLKYMRKSKTMENHKLSCNAFSPPGKQIYKEDTISMYEVDGKECKIYCQNLCLLSKLFLDHKTLYYDVEPFLFYILCEADECGHHIVGYFSKEKVSQENYNLACILTFPPYQRKGYGKFLISVSYELTKREEKTGSPEKPLSDLGKISYRSYWAYVIVKFLISDVENITLQEIAKSTGIRLEDILSTLHSLNLLKYWKGQHIISISLNSIETFAQQSKKVKLCDPRCLTWTPSEKFKKSILPPAPIPPCITSASNATVTASTATLTPPITIE